MRTIRSVSGFGILYGFKSWARFWSTWTNLSISVSPPEEPGARVGSGSSTPSQKAKQPDMVKGRWVGSGRSEQRRNMNGGITHMSSTPKCSRRYSKSKSWHLFPKDGVDPSSSSENSLKSRADDSIQYAELIADSSVFKVGNSDLAQGGRDECLVLTGLNDGRFRRFCFNVKVDVLAMVIFHRYEINRDSLLARKVGRKSREPRPNYISNQHLVVMTNNSVGLANVTASGVTSIHNHVSSRDLPRFLAGYNGAVMDVFLINDMIQREKQCR